MAEVLLVDTPADGIRRLRINRPDKRNAINADVRLALRAALSNADQDPGCRAVVIGGVDGHFSAGGDLPSMVGISQQQARQRMADIHLTCRTVVDFPKPVVAAMEGYAVGAGIGLALLCDAIVAGPSSKILYPFLKLGLTPDWGSVYTLPRRVGLAQARIIMTSGEIIAGEDLLLRGIADAFADDVMETAVQRAVQLATLSPMAFAALKRRLNEPSQSLDQELDRELNDQEILLVSDDFKEGYDAFMNKRQPEFK